MKLQDDFFTIQRLEERNNEKAFSIKLNPDHGIYKAHFPGNPITPGACIIQMVKELTENATGTSLFLKIIKNIKFTQVINPLQNPEILFLMTIVPDGVKGYKVTVDVQNGEQSFAKLSLQFIPV